MEVTVTTTYRGFLATIDQIEAMLRALCAGEIENASTRVYDKDDQVDSVRQLMLESDGFTGIDTWFEAYFKSYMKQLREKGEVSAKSSNSSFPGMLRYFYLDIERTGQKDIYYVKVRSLNYHKHQNLVSEEMEIAFATYLSTTRGVLINVSAPMAQLGARFLIDLDPVVEGIKPFIMNDKFKGISGEGLAGGCLYYAEQNSGRLPELLIWNSSGLKVFMSFCLGNSSPMGGFTSSETEKVNISGSRLSGGFQNGFEPTLKFAFISGKNYSDEHPILIAEDLTKAEELAGKLAEALQKIELPESL